MAKSIFKVGPYLKDLDPSIITGEEDVSLLEDLASYIKITNKPKTKVLKTKEGADFNTGDLGDPVELQTDFGWSIHYYPPKGASSASIEVAAPKYAENAVGLSIESIIFRTAIEVVDLLDTQGWNKFKIEEGTPKLIWAVWGYLKHTNRTVTGFKPTAFDKVRLENSAHDFDLVSQSLAEKTVDSRLLFSASSGRNVSEDGVGDE